MSGYVEVGGTATEWAIRERQSLEAVAAPYTAPFFEVARAKLVLYAADGLENQAITARLNLPRRIVSK